MQHTKRGVTMIELVVYFGLAVLISVLLFNFFYYGRRTYEAGSQSFLAGTEAEAAIRYLKFDLSATTLGSVRVYPNPGQPSEAAGLSLISAHDYSSGTFQIGPYGAPQWSKYVFYTVEKGSGGKFNLVRWEQVRQPASLLAAATSILPSAQTDKKNRRVILRGIAPAGFAHKAMKDPLGPAGGFQVTFVRSDGQGELKSERPGESLTVWNPAQVTDGSAAGLTFAGNTRLMEVSLTFVLPDSTTGKESAVHLPFRITPRN